MNIHKKEGIILGLMVLLFVVSWFSFASSYFSAVNIFAVSPWIFVVFAFLAYSIALTVEIDRKHWIIGTLIAGLSPIPFFLFSGGVSSAVYTLAGSLILFVFLYWGAHIANEERTERVKMKLRRILPRGLGRALTGFALAIALFFLASPLSSINAPALKIPPEFLGDILFPVARTLGADIPHEVSNLTTDEIGALLAYTEGEDQTIIADRTLNLMRERGFGDKFDTQTIYAVLGDYRIFDAVRSDLRKSIADTPPSVLETRRENLSDRFRVELTGDEELGEIFASSFSEAYLQPRALEDLAGAIPILLAVTLFAAVRIVGILFMWLVILLTWLILLFLRSSDIVKLEKIGVEKENFVL